MIAQSPANTASSLDPGTYRAVLGQYPTGVTAITATDEEGRPLGMIVGTFSSVSLDPPLVSFMASRDSSSFAAIRQSPTFCANVLAGDQEGVCRTLSVKGATDKFADLDWRAAPLGSPVIDGVLAWIECRPRTVVEAGDHVIVIGEVMGLESTRSALPLLFLGGGYGRFSPHSRVVAASPDIMDQLRLADLARTPMEALGRRLGLECAAVAPVEDVLVRVASAGVPIDGRRPARVGVRLPFEAPMGSLLVAWEDQVVQDRWMNRADPDMTDEEREAHGLALQHVRDRGWTITLAGDVFRELDASIEQLSSGSGDDVDLAALNARLSGSAAYDPGDIDPHALYDVRNLSAPVRDADQRVVMYLSVFGFEAGTSGRRVLQVAEELVNTAAGVGQAVIGTHQEAP